MRTVAFVFAAVSCTSAWAEPLPDPIAPASKGQLQCHSPDVVRRTCNSLAGYKARPDGVIENTATVLVSQNPVVTVEMTTIVKIKSGQVCGAILKKDIDTARVVSEGKPLDNAHTAAFRKLLKESMQGILGREICTAYEAKGASFIAHASIDGKPQPDHDQPVMWVSPDEGYTVKP
jgi:hypothetical protein